MVDARGADTLRHLRRLRARSACEEGGRHGGVEVCGALLPEASALLHRHGGLRQRRPQRHRHRQRGVSGGGAGGKVLGELRDASGHRPQGRRGAHLKGQSGLRCAQALPLPTKRRRNGGQAQCILWLDPCDTALRRRALVPHCEDGTGGCSAHSTIAACGPCAD